MEVHGKDLKTWNNDDIDAFLSLRRKSKVEENDNRDSGLEEDNESDKVEKKIAEDTTVSDLEVTLSVSVNDAIDLRVHTHIIVFFRSI